MRASASASPSNKYSGLFYFRIHWFDLLAVHGTLKSLLVVVQSLSHVQLFATTWTAAHQASLSFTISQSLLKLMSVELVMLSNHLILCHPLLLLPSLVRNST